jgi:hypothetical protein
LLDLVEVTGDCLWDILVNQQSEVHVVALDVMLSLVDDGVHDTLHIHLLPVRSELVLGDVVHLPEVSDFKLNVLYIVVGLVKELLALVLDEDVQRLELGLDLLGVV